MRLWTGFRAELYHSIGRKRATQSDGELPKRNRSVGSNSPHAQSSLRYNFVGRLFPRVYHVVKGTSCRSHDEGRIHIATVSRVACPFRRTDSDTPSFPFSTAGCNSYRDDNVQSCRACDHCDWTNLRTFPVRSRGAEGGDTKRESAKTEFARNVAPTDKRGR